MADTDTAGSNEIFLFLASTVHDMKNVISVLSGTLEGLLDDASPPVGPAYSKMAHMLYQTRRLNDNLMQLLAIGHLVIGVLGHAINNAIDYTADTIRLAIATVDGCLELRVEDNGPGYPAAMLEAGASAMSGVSTGLGLYFSSDVAKMHKHRERHGALRLENGGSYGGGCFVLTLP